MPVETTYSSLRQNLASVLDRVVDEQDTVVVRRRGAREVALMPVALESPNRSSMYLPGAGHAVSHRNTGWCIASVTKPSTSCRPNTTTR
jgi:prevent-host-death family protein